MKRLFSRVLTSFAILLFGMASPATAEWRVAESDNFVIYAEDSEKDLTRFAEMLERYHAAMSFVTGRETEPPSPSNRVTIFVAGGQRDIRRLAGTDSRYVAGFYRARAGGSVAFVQDIKLTSGDLNWSMIILLHEYAHHYIISASRYGMPRWISEGSAEFFASAKFFGDGTVQIGRPANHRASDFAYAEDVTVRELLDPALYEAKRGKAYDAFYGKAWALYHYLSFNEERSGQLSAYMRAIMSGAASPVAAEEAFGDIGKLEREVKTYLRSRRMTTFNLKPEVLSIGSIRVRELSKGAGEMMPVVMQSKRGVNDEQAATVLEQARKIAPYYPDDPFVLAALAEAEFDAGNDDAAIAAADAAIARDPASANAFLQKGYALFRKAEAAEDQDAAYRAAMEPFSKLNGLETDHPLPLLYYFRSYADRGLEPPEQAKHALERAAQLAPFDKSLWMNVGTMQAGEGQIALAQFSLAPIANDPHGGSSAESAKALIALLEQAPEGEPFDIGAARALANLAQEDGGGGGEPGEQE